LKGAGPSTLNLEYDTTDCANPKYFYIFKDFYYRTTGLVEDSIYLDKMSIIS